jgi:hypothetical protein
MHDCQNFLNLGYLTYQMSFGLLSESSFHDSTIIQKCLFDKKYINLQIIENSKKLEFSLDMNVRLLLDSYVF